MSLPPSLNTRRASLFSEALPDPPRQNADLFRPLIFPTLDDVYHDRYVALSCQGRHGDAFFESCCHPLLATETLEGNREAQCNPANLPSASSSAAAPASTSAAPVEEEEEECDAEEETATSSAAPAPVQTTAAEVQAAVAPTTTAPAPAATTTKAAAPATTTKAAAPAVTTKAAAPSGGDEKTGGFATCTCPSFFAHETTH